jgi:Uma2 family endonuclease
MGGATQEQRKYTIAEYLEEELRRGEKLEYYNGYIYPMPGGTIPHNRIASNLLGELLPHSGTNRSLPSSAATRKFTCLNLKPWFIPMPW